MEHKSRNATGNQTNAIDQVLRELTKQPILARFYRTGVVLKIVNAPDSFSDQNQLWAYTDNSVYRVNYQNLPTTPDDLTKVLTDIDGFILNPEYSGFLDAGVDQLPQSKLSTYTGEAIQLKTISLESVSIVSESSYGDSDLGKHDVNLTLYLLEGNLKSGRFTAELEIPTLYELTSIGLWIENGALEDYDGIMGYPPTELLTMLRELGITVGEEFEPEVVA